MKLSSILVKGFLLCGIIASPAATESSINAESSTFSSDNSTDSIMAEAGGEGRFCFGANSKYNVCHGSVEKCVKKRTGGSKDKSKIDDATKLCKFYCSEVMNTTQCKQSKYKADYHPNWSCDKQQYCY
ncbi:putative secreted protein [Wickerhamomyces ciferrii]|uniref:Secreted protein n=1 Tax=Wickerhamomyces ciferrii (strain ATCC 14091 / BCRC 22168 / CBS 111 / JCM 3599 / NBRC 0793 / NRRL Y-1031 F-60-10) TaxID=1206466 RepID=K0KY77_WICCF|nr:uncharacterized protein BN7_6636 [Wickerhamomyces ciferrii]CCH47027.1 putative secreted protein [Wickerhamomyces ciferrii]